jgi:hypothetical protein
VQNRSGIILREGMLLKSDQWLRQGTGAHAERGVRGALHFRRVPGTPLYALGQPTADAVDEVVRRVRADHPEASRILWITLREEPVSHQIALTGLVELLNAPVDCVREWGAVLSPEGAVHAAEHEGSAAALAHLLPLHTLTSHCTDYGGISASRLEALEDRLRQDVQTELAACGGRLLLHTETASGAVVPVWEAANADAVETVRDVLGARRAVAPGVELVHARIPLTAERAPDFSDVAELMEVVMRSDSVHTPIVVNCQLGRGRSTLASVSCPICTSTPRALTAAADHSDVDHGLATQAAGIDVRVPVARARTPANAHALEHVRGADG